MTVPSKCLSCVWFIPTAYNIVPDVGDRILNIVPPNVCPDEYGVSRR
jgi:hypothetical protein